MKTAIVTGASRGIGAAVTEKLLARGFHVHMISRSGKADARDNTSVWKLNLGDYEAAAKLFAELPTPDLLVNNAGYMNKLTAREYDETELLHILQVNLISAVRTSISVAEKMAERGSGRVVSLGSIAGQIGHPDIWYGISKAGLMNAMRSLARTYGARGVSFFSVAPGPVETDMQLSNDEARKARLRAATISQRFASAEEVAEIVVWLGTDAPEYISGEVIDVNSGTNFR